MYFDSCGALCVFGLLGALFLWYFGPPLLGGVLGGVLGGLAFRRVSPWAGGFLGVVVGLLAGAVSIDFLASAEWRDAVTVAGITFGVMVAVCFALSRLAMWRARGNETVD